MLRRLARFVLPVDRFTASDRRITFTIWLAGLVQGFAQSQVSATLPFTRAGLGLTESSMSLLLGLARLASFAALPLGWLADRRGRRRPFLAGVCLVVAGSVLAGTATAAWQFGLFHGLLRVGTATMAGLGVVVLAETVTPTVRAYAISFYGAAVSLGSGIAVLALPLADGGGDRWRIPHLLAGAGALLIPLLVRRVPETKGAHAMPGSWRDLVGGPWASRFWRVATAGFLASAYGTFITSFMTERLVGDLGLDTGTGVWVMLLGGTIGGLGFFAGGRMADHIGRRVASVAAVLLGTGGGIAVFTATSLPALVAGIFLASFGTFAMVPAGGAHRAELFPADLRSRANTAAANFTLAGAAAGLLAGAVAIEAFGLSGTAGFLAIGAVLAAVITWTLPETLRDHPPAL
ncbi:MAG: MFS transporter [Actinomycetes bacterium]